MAKKASTSSSAKSNKPKKSAPAVVARSTPVRNTPIPKVATAARTGAAKAGLSITHEMIARRAYFISVSGHGSTPDENWHRAERELRAGA